MLITLEGTDGAGKTTQLGYITKCLDCWGVRHIVSREPGGTVIGNQIRSVLLDVNNNEIDPNVELLLCVADRIQHIRDVIRPSINDGLVVICDRYIDSTLVYQGFARGLDVSVIRYLHNTLCGGLMPDITLLMDLDPSVGLLRTEKRASNLPERAELRFDHEDINFYRKVRKGYLELAKFEPKRFFVVDAKLDERQVNKQIEVVIKKRLLKWGGRLFNLEKCLF